MKAKVNIRDYLADLFGSEIEVPARIDIDELLELAHVAEEHAFDIDIDEMLAENCQIAHIWAIDDVQHVRPDLDDDQAWQVLQTIDCRLDSERGITWETVEIAAHDLFGPESENWQGRIDVTVEGYDREHAIEHFSELAAHIQKDAVNTTTRATFDPASLQAANATKAKNK